METRRAQVEGPTRFRRRWAFTVALASVLVALIGASPAAALVLPPTTIDGPTNDIIEFGNVAMAADGTGGLVYTKRVGATPHVFASRFAGGSWQPPVRVDSEASFEGAEPRIAAANGGALEVVWVTPVATVKSKVRRGLYSAKLDPGASQFGPQLLVDGNLGSGVGTDPSLAGAQAGKAYVAYRVITNDFSEPGTTAVQLRPGDVMAEVRLARLEGGRWSRVGVVNRNPAASMRPPSPSNGPQVGVGATGSAVVAWQEPDQTGVARIWLRRIFGSTLGPQSEASPAAWEGQPVTADVDAFDLAVTATDQSRIAMRVAAAPGSALGGQRLFLNSLKPNYQEGGGTPTGPVLADGGGSSAPAGGVGPPAVAASGENGGEGSLLLAFVSGGESRQMRVEKSGTLVPAPSPPGPPPAPGNPPTVAAVDPSGGGFVAYPALDASGSVALAVRQELPSGAAQTGLVSGTLAGPIPALSIGRSEAGEALLGFVQGEPGNLEIVGDRVAAPPRSLSLKAPAKWVKPKQAKLIWNVPASGVGGVTYSVLVEGRVVREGLRRLRFSPPPAALGSGVRSVQVLATDGLGQQLLSKAKKVKIDGLAPEAAVRVKRGAGRVTVTIADPDSGLMSKAVRVDFGDGTKLRGKARAKHVYAKPGPYTVRVRARDRVGNVLARRFRVRVR